MFMTKILPVFKVSQGQHRGTDRFARLKRAMCLADESAVAARP